MPTLADELARLVSALHGTGSDGNCLILAEGAVYGSGPAKSTTAGAIVLCKTMVENAC